MAAQAAALTAASAACAKGLLLPMLSSGLGDAAHRFARGLLVFLLRDVAERDDADQPLLAVHHRQAPHLDIAHVLGHVLEILVFEDVLYFLAHDLAHRRVRAFAQRHRADRDVAVGNHAHEPVVLSHRHRAGVDLRHDLGNVADGLAGIGNAHVARHRFADSHEGLLWGIYPCDSTHRRWFKTCGYPETRP